MKRLEWRGRGEGEFGEKMVRKMEDAGIMCMGMLGRKRTGMGEMRELKWREREKRNLGRRWGGKEWMLR